MSDTSTKGPLAMTTDSVTELLDAYDAETTSLPLGHEKPTLGASAYNWRRAIVNELRALYAASPPSPAPAESGAVAAVLGSEDDLHSVAHALDIGSIGAPYRAYQGSVYCDYQSHRIADFQDYGLALAATVLFNNAKAIKAALAALDSPPDHGGGEGLDLLATMATHLGWELDWGPRDPNDEEGEYGWRVHDRRGNRSDLEWTLIGFGASPADALRAALRSQP